MSSKLLEWGKRLLRHFFVASTLFENRGPSFSVECLGSIKLLNQATEMRIWSLPFPAGRTIFIPKHPNVLHHNLIYHLISLIYVLDADIAGSFCRITAGLHRPDKERINSLRVIGMIKFLFSSLTEKRRIALHASHAYAHNIIAIVIIDVSRSRFNF